MTVSYQDGRALTNANRRERRDELMQFLYRRAGSLGILGIAVIVEENPLRVRFPDGDHERLEFVTPTGTVSGQSDFQLHDVVQIGRAHV